MLSHSLNLAPGCYAGVLVRHVLIGRVVSSKGLSLQVPLAEPQTIAYPSPDTGQGETGKSGSQPGQQKCTMGHGIEDICFACAHLFPLLLGVVNVHLHTRKEVHGSLL